MKPAIAFPFVIADPLLLAHLPAILPDLKEHFERAYFSVLPSADCIDQLQADDFFSILKIDPLMQVGEHFKFLYQQAADLAHPDQILHLCFLDRIAFVLQTEYRDAFLADIDRLSLDDMPLLFQRSQSAWETHPRYYRSIEGLVTAVGHNLFDKDLDYAWCHLAVRAGQLREIMSLVKKPDMSMLAETIVHLQDDIKTCDVDWLAWEDPFILSRNASELKNERDTNLDEIKKRLRYVMPMIETITRLSRNGRKS